MSPTTSPWWGVPVIAGVFLIIGAGLGFWFNWVLDGRRQSRAEAIRWDSDIREYVAELLGVVQTLIHEHGKRVRMVKFMNDDLTARMAKATETVVGHVVSGPQMEDLVSSTVARARVNVPYITKSEKRTRLAWEQVYTLTASITLVAPRDVCDSLSNLIDVADNALRHENAEGLSTEDSKAINRAVNVLADSVRSHLGMAPILDD